MEWEPKLVGLLTTVLSCRLKDDMPTKSAASERVGHGESIGRKLPTTTPRPVRQCWGWRTCGSKRTPSGTARGSRAGHRRERKSSRSREHNSTLTAILCQCRSVRIRRAKARAKGISMGEDTKNESSKKSESGRPEKGYYCQKTGHAKSQCKTRLTEPCRRSRETRDCKLSSERHSSGRATSLFHCQTNTR